MNHLICLRCGHIFNNKANLNKHYRRITECFSKYYEYDYKYLRYNHDPLKKKRIELLIFIYDTKKVNNILIKNDIPSESLYKKIQNHVDEIDTQTNYVNFYDRIYKCFCGSKFNHQSSLSRHKKLKHIKKETLMDLLIKNNKNKIKIEKKYGL
jgi:hypothetical protein